VISLNATALTSFDTLAALFQEFHLILLLPRSAAEVAPATLTVGSIEDLRLPNTVLIDEWGANLLGRTVKRPDGTTEVIPLGVGDTFELNDAEARIVGVCRVKRAFTGGPFVYTTYDRAKTYTAGVRRSLSYVLVEPRPGVTPLQLCDRIEAETGLRAWTSETDLWTWGERSLARSTFWWFWRNTGIPFSFGTAVLLGLFVGIAISGQTFYSFVLENLRYFAAIKAMGASSALLARMLLLQALVAGMLGFGLGVGMAQGIGRAMIEKGMPPFVLYPQVLVATLVLVLGISVCSALIGMIKVARVDPASVFRA